MRPCRLLTRPRLTVGVALGTLMVDGCDGGSDSSSPTRTTDELATVLAEHRPNQRVRVALRRADGSRTTVDVRLGGSPG